MKSFSFENFSIYIPFSRASISTSLIFSGSQNFLFDVGDGTLIFYIKKKLPFPNYIFISHEHVDHIGGLLSLLTYLKLKNHFPIIFHPLAGDIIKAIKKIFSKRYGSEVFNFIKITPERKIEIDKNIIVPHRAKHDSSLYKLHSLCFEIFFNSHSFFYSGDTAFFPGLKKYIQGKDMAFLEASFRGNNSKLEQKHLSYKKANELGKLATSYYLLHRR